MWGWCAGAGAWLLAGTALPEEHACLCKSQLLAMGRHRTTGRLLLASAIRGSPALVCTCVRLETHAWLCQLRASLPAPYRRTSVGW